MSSEKLQLVGLVIDDDQAVLDGFSETLPLELCGFTLLWEFKQSFDDALKWLLPGRYDFVVTDLFLGKPELENARGEEIVRRIRERLFCPVLVVTSGPLPEDFSKPFVLLSSKDDRPELESQLAQLLQTGIPRISRMLRNDIASSTKRYLWEFLESKWAEIQEYTAENDQALERLIRRRAAFQLGQLAPGKDDPDQVSRAEGAEFYIYPSLDGDYCLGEIVRSRDDNALSVIVTPHCYLAVQPDDTEARADHVLLVPLFPAQQIIDKSRGEGQAWPNDEGQALEKLRKRINCPPVNLGKPNGRYWFFPGFLDIPDSYCDFLQANSVPMSFLKEKLDRVATVDSPFAEAFQARFNIFYSAVGIPTLDPARFQHMIGE